MSDLDERLFFELHNDRFTEPERRSVRHIPITSNGDFAEINAVPPEPGSRCPSSLFFPVWLAKPDVWLPLPPLEAAIVTAFACPFLLGVLLGRVSGVFWLRSGVQTLLIAVASTSPHKYALPGGEDKSPRARRDAAGIAILFQGVPTPLSVIETVAWWRVLVRPGTSATRPIKAPKEK